MDSGQKQNCAPNGDDLCHHHPGHIDPAWVQYGTICWKMWGKFAGIISVYSVYFCMFLYTTYVASGEMSPFCNPLSTLHLATWCSTRLCLRFFDVLLRISCCQRRGHTWLSRSTRTQFLGKTSTGAMAASRHNRSLPPSSCCYRHSCHHLTVFFLAWHWLGKK